MLATITEPSALTDHQLTTSITHAHRNLTRNKAAFIIHLAEFDHRGLGGSSGTASWAARTQDLSRRTVFEYLQVGRALRDSPCSPPASPTVSSPTPRCASSCRT
ncbi:hypothetical protein [Corynebacterium sp.]|uniref:hypothetical protein n=1 Tax=Corynebacterium sp. TaxID=1720 RepID=UPI00198D90C6|nr:hypothetical protein [Corynebacterium sp.]HHU66380.1 hypothetical protein [Corynebacterium sp.]